MNVFKAERTKVHMCTVHVDKEYALPEICDQFRSFDALVNFFCKSTIFELL